jgi:hypothetical protein
MMSLLRWFRRSLRPGNVAPRRPTFRPTCEALEARELLSTTPLLIHVEHAPPLASASTSGLHATAVHGPARVPKAHAPAAMSSSLTIGGQPMVPTSPDYARDFKALTVIGNPAEDRLRVQIFKAMSQNPAFTFRFANLYQAKVNFNVRIAIIEFMNTVEAGTVKYPKAPGQFGYFKPGAPATANPAYWDTATNNKGARIPVFTSLPIGYSGTDWWGNPIPVYDNYTAILSIPKAPFCGECYSTASLAVLYGTAKVLGKDAFNTMFPGPLTFGWGSLQNPSVYSLTQNYLIAPPFQGANPNTIITTKDMVPGDWVYIKNMDGYKGGYFNGENAICMGIGPTSHELEFSGLGLYHETQTQLQKALYNAYLKSQGKPPLGKNDPVPKDALNPQNSKDILWEVDNSPSVPF